MAMKNAKNRCGKGDFFSLTNLENEMWNRGSLVDWGLLFYYFFSLHSSMLNWLKPIIFCQSIIPAESVLSCALRTWSNFCYNRKKINHCWLKAGFWVMLPKGLYVSDFFTGFMSITEVKEVMNIAGAFMKGKIGSS